MEGWSDVVIGLLDLGDVDDADDGDGGGDDDDVRVTAATVDGRERKLFSDNNFTQPFVLRNSDVKPHPVKSIYCSLSSPNPFPSPIFCPCTNTFTSLIR